MTEASDREAAFHEAGHAALHVWLSMPLRWASIVPDLEAGNVGSVAGYPPPKYVRDWFDEGGLNIYGRIPLRVRDWLERDMMKLKAVVMETVAILERAVQDKARK